MQNKKYIKIESQGIIDPQAFTLIGASTKRLDDTKIGFFGSGLKYSISYLLRNSIDFKVFADYNEIKFECESVTFREQSFEVISVNGEKTSMTTEMGIDWEPWFIIREIYCNAIDEGEGKISIVENIVPEEDKTVFYIRLTKEFQEIFNDWDEYFSEGRKDLMYFDNEGSQIYSSKNKLIVYRKGIKCFSIDQPSIFNYDMTWININESRTIKDEHDFKWTLRTYFQELNDVNIIRQLITLINNNWEKGLYWQYGSAKYSTAWLDAIGDKILIPYESAGLWNEMYTSSPYSYLTLPNDMVEGLKKAFADKIKIIGDSDGVSANGEFKQVINLNKRQQAMMNDAISFLKDCNYDIKYPVKVVEFIKKGVLGQAKDNTILLSVRLFDLGKRELVSTFIEEQEHLVTGYNDESREFQNHFINKMISLMEDLNNKYL
jgi:hypothetical protein